MTPKRRKSIRRKKTLERLYAEHSGKASDKWSSYFVEYERIFTEYRERPVRLLEIGVQNGGSLEIWSRFFPNAKKIVGCDIDPLCARLRYKAPRIAVVVGDANSDAAQAAILGHEPTFDIIIDDGSHRSSDIVKSFARYFPCLADGGVYIVEDLHCSYWRKFEGGLYDPFSSLTFFKRLTDVLNHEHWRIEKPRRDILRGFFSKYGFRLSEEVLQSVHSVQFTNSLCVVRKENPERNRLNARVIAGSVAIVEPEVLGWHSRPTPLTDQSSNEWTARSMPPGEELPLRMKELAEREAKARDLGAKLQAQEAQAAERDRHIAGRDAEIARLKGELAGALTQAQDKLAALEEKAAKARGLAAKLQAQEAQAAERDRHIAGRDAEIARLKGELAGALTQAQDKLAALEEKAAKARDLTAKLQAQEARAAERERWLTKQLGTSFRRIEMLVEWMERLEHVIGGLLNSRRWKTGNMLGNVGRRLLRKPRVTMGVDILSDVLGNFNSWKKYSQKEAKKPPDHIVKDKRPTPTEPSKEVRPAKRTDLKNSLPVSVRKHNLKVAVIAWDVGHNPVGRAYLIAEALSRHFEVIIIGPQFPRYGQTVWKPLLGSPVPILSFPGTQHPQFAEELSRIARRLDCDAIVVSKPRMPSMHLGLLAKHVHERPLLIDIDDYEPSFCKDHSPIDFATLSNNAVGTELSEPYSDTWTRFAESLVCHADAVLVSNETLREKFGGTIIPHARDETLFDPNLYDRETCRAEIGVAQTDKVVLIAGTVRRHKGVVELAEALASLQRSDYKLCILGSIPDRGLEARIRQAAGDNLILIPYKPLHEVPKHLMAADLVCALQDSSSEISRYQLPAKIVDAFAMGIPVLATETPPLRRLIKLGAVTTVTTKSLAGALAKALDNSDQLRQAQRERRWLFEAEFSYRAISTKLEKIILDALANTRPLDPQALAFQKLLQRPTVETAKRAPGAAGTQATKSKRRDVVLFWKQYDTGVYGRRLDMLAKYFARHESIRRVMDIEPPLSLWELRRKGAQRGITEHQTVYREILARRLGLRDRENLSFHTFVYSASRREPVARWQYPTAGEYMEYLERLFKEYDVHPGNSIFWLCPVNRLLPDIVRRFRPQCVVTDIIDDQRRWPGLNEQTIKEREQNYKDVIELSDLVVTNSVGVKESMAPFAPGIRLLPNAAELEPPVWQPDFDLSRLQAIPRPRLGFVGNLESKIDIELLEFIARARPDWSLVFVGSTHTSSDVLVLDRFPNVHFMGVVKYEEARFWMQHFDVALLPHLDTPLTRSMNPLKLFVYLSLGLPVVSTAIMNIDTLKRHLYLIESKETSIQVIEQALAAGQKNGRAELQRDLEINSWEARIDQALKWITDLETRQHASSAHVARRTRPGFPI